MSRDFRDEWIARVALGKSFIDVGGLWGLVNEKVSIAHEAGATDLCMLDIWQADSEWWRKFRERCTTKDVGPVREVIASIDNPFIARRVGKYDIVHCSGVLYHCPNPFLTVRNLMSLARDTVLLAVAVMPAVIENEFGRLKFGDECAVCVPLIVEDSRKIVDKYITDHYGGGPMG